MNRGYRSVMLKELRDQQVRFAPREKKLEQALRAELLLGEIEPQRTYSYEYLCFRITEFRPDPQPQRTASGADVRHDLRLFVEDVSESANLRVEEATEKVYTVDDLSRQFQVAAKTIARWRELGLVGRRFLAGGKWRLGFLQSSLDRFVVRHRSQIERGKSFSRLSEPERQSLVEAARKLAAQGLGASETARRLASDTGRSMETIRYTLKSFDEEFPQLAVFSDRQERLDTEKRRDLLEQFRQGTSVSELAKALRRPASSIYRAIAEARAEAVVTMGLDFVPSPEFQVRNASKSILAALPAAACDEASQPPAGLPPYLADLYTYPLLTPEQERHLFRKFNYHKYLATKSRDALARRPTTKILDAIEAHFADAQATKNVILQSNLRLVVSIARRHVSSLQDLPSLVSDGNLVLIRAIETFDYLRGNKFSTYASWALMKHFARAVPEEQYRTDRLRVLDLELSGPPTDQVQLGYEQESEQIGREQTIGRMLSRLDDREQRIIITRFGLDHRHEPRTLQQVGDELGVTRERIRQIELRALEKLRQAVEQEKIDFRE